MDRYVISKAAGAGLEGLIPDAQGFLRIKRPGAEILIHVDVVKILARSAAKTRPPLSSPR